MNPIARCIAVLFPAPLGPRKPKISPVSTERENCCRARTRRRPDHERYSFVIPSYSNASGISF